MKQRKAKKTKSERAVEAYKEACDSKTDVLGSYTGSPKGEKENVPAQDADDL